MSLALFIAKSSLSPERVPQLLLFAVTRLFAYAIILQRGFRPELFRLPENFL